MLLKKMMKNVFEDKSVKRNVLRVWWTGKYIKWIRPQNRFLNWTEIDASYMKEEVGDEWGGLRCHRRLTRVDLDSR